MLDEVAAASGSPEHGFRWILEVKPEGTLEQYADSGRFPTLDAKLSSALTRIAQGELARKINLKKEEMRGKRMLPKGRQVLHMVLCHFKMAEAEGSLLEFQDLLEVCLIGDNTEQFAYDWRYTLSGLRKEPDDNVKEALIRMQLNKSARFREHFSHYNRLPAREKTYGALSK